MIQYFFAGAPQAEKQCARGEGLDEAAQPLV